MKNTISIKGDTVSVNVSVYLFIDKDYPEPNMWIAYCPSLNLIAYDYGEKAAQKDFEFVLNEYITEQLQNNTLEKDLKRYGWKKVNRVYDEPKTIDMAGRDNMLSDILNIPAYSKINVGTAYRAYV